MWIFEQRTGRLRDANGQGVGFGYSGHGEGRNNPEMQDRPNVGPCPCGVYDLNSPRDTTSHGPYVLPLTPKTTNVMFGRSGFLVHGDSVTTPGTASHGCLILPRSLRQQLWDSGDHTICVVA